MYILLHYILGNWAHGEERDREGGKGEGGGVREEGVKGGAQIRRPDYTNKRLRRQTFVN